MTEHPHIHRHDCTCGCHGSAPHDNHQAAHSLAEHALILSRTWSGSAGNPVDRSDRTRSGLLRLAGTLEEDGVVLGHLKAMLCCGNASLALSVTRADTLDETPSPAWPPAVPADWTLTVNVLSLVHTDAVTEETLDALFG